MKTFTIRDLDREPAKVLAAADHDGVARVRSRDGRTYSLRPENAPPASETGWAAYARSRQAGLKKLFPDGPVMTADQARTFDRLLADDASLL